MKKIILLILITLISCNGNNQKETSKSSDKKSISVIKYINSQNGLNYRDQPNGTILGGFKNNDEVHVIQHTGIFTEITNNNKLIKGEWVGISIKKDTVYVFDAFLSTHKNYTDVWSKFPLKTRPYTDTTSFDNIKLINQLNSQDIATLQLQKVYPDLNQKNHHYKFYPSYKIDFPNHNNIVVIVCKGEHEIESVLIIYDTDNKLIQVYNEKSKLQTNSVVLAYDEIAEGWSRTSSKIRNNCITTIDALYTDPPVIDTTVYHINNDGYINRVDTDFKNLIHPNTAAKLHTIYVDTIQFKAYNDNYDYLILEGKKDNREVSFIYNWDWNDKYNFKKDDYIQIKWKLDSIFIAGDGESLDFSEYVIDATKINITFD